MLKHCPVHGAERVLVADDVDYYRRCREVFLKHPEMPQRYNTPVKWGCPYDCGLCTDHEQHSCLSLVEIADACNLTCPICYADSGVHRPEFRDLATVQKMFDAVVRNEGEPDVVQISGGEPTIHPDFFAILDMAKKTPIRHLMVNTNGIRIAQDEEFTARLAGYMPNFEVYLQFDSFERDALMRLRGADLRGIREKALERLNRHGLSTTLVVTVEKGVNDHEIGKIIDFALRAAVRARRDAAAGAGRRPARGLRRRARSPDAHRSAAPHPRADVGVPARGRHPGAVPSGRAGDGLRAQGRRQRHPAHRAGRSEGADRGRPQHDRLRARRAGAAGHPQAVRHQPLAVVEHRQPAGPALLPAGGAGAGGARLQEPVPDHHHAVHRRARLRRAIGEEELRAHRPSEGRPADPVRHLQPVLPRRPGTDAARRRCGDQQDAWRNMVGV